MSTRTTRATRAALTTLVDAHRVRLAALPHPARTRRGCEWAAVLTLADYGDWWARNPGATAARLAYRVEMLQRALGLETAADRQRTAFAVAHAADVAEITAEAERRAALEAEGLADELTLWLGEIPTLGDRVTRQLQRAATELEAVDPRLRSSRAAEVLGAARGVLAALAPA